MRLFSDLQPEYSQKLEVTFQHADPQTWCEVFNDWAHMALKDELVTLKDFYLVRQSTWVKL